jgi:20S proteasome subunit alpha 7
MSSIGTGYDQSTTTFSPDGRVFQVEYAAKAVENSSTAVGIRCKDGVVMAVEKPKLSKMLVEGSNRRIMHINKQIGMCVSGMIADARQIVNHGRQEASRYLDMYGSTIPGDMLCDRVAGLMHTYTLYWCALPPSPLLRQPAPPLIWS